jgi:molybdopterin converting factor small subunit
LAVRVRLCDPLKQYTGNRVSVTLDSCDTVADVIRSLEREHPGIGSRILDDQDNVRRFVNVFLNGDLVKGRPERTAVGSDAEVYIIQSVAGG